MIELQKLAALPALFRDYIDKNPELKPYYGTHYTEISSLEDLAKFQDQRSIDRQLLYSVLTQQYEGISLYSVQKENLQALKNPNTFTVTTGHQLCLFGGPWFVAYKILATIAYAQHLQQLSSNYKIVPIFWLASEDHDIAEIQSLSIQRSKIYYPTDYQGVTGNLPLKGIRDTLDLVFTHLEKGIYAPAIKKILTQSYQPHFTLKQATRLFIQQMFGHLGILVLDAQVNELKSKFLPIAQQEIEQNTTYTKVRQTLAELHQLGYKTYANPQPINLFYIYDNYQREKWNAQKHTINFNRPYHISPNVLLRPLYQELILPNLAYVGGPNEIAYWLSLKGTFEAFSVPFPILVPRYFGLQIPSNYLAWIKKHEIDLFTLLHTTQEKFLADYFQAQIDQDTEVQKIKHKWEQFKQTLIDYTVQQKLGLEASAMAAITRMEKHWSHFYTKIRKEKQRNASIFHQKLSELYNYLLPHNTWQERSESYLDTYAIYGNALWSSILQKPITEPYFWIWEI